MKETDKRRQGGETHKKGTQIENNKGGLEKEGK